MDRIIEHIPKGNLLGVLFFAAAFGFAVGKKRSVSKPIIDVCNAILQVSLTLIHWFIW